MLILNAHSVAAALPCQQLVSALDKAFREDVAVPVRAQHEIPVPGGTPGTLLLMPAWRSGAYIGIKIATVFPDNATRRMPAVAASYLLLNGETGQLVALLDGTELTVRRTAAASALASGYLSRKDAASLLMVGTGNLAPHLVRTHASVRPITEVCIWGRRDSAAHRLAKKLAGATFRVSVTQDLEAAVRAADIISCATLAAEPIIKGEWLKPGQHLDLVGAYTPAMSEADSDAVAVAEVFVDTREGALTEAGEIVQAIKKGVFHKSDIRGSLRDLCTGVVTGRTSGDDITLFKSVGTALEDLAAAELVLQNHNAKD